MARRKKSYSRKGKAIPVAIMAPLVDVGYRLAKAAMARDTNHMSVILTGYSPIDQGFNAQEVLRTYGSLAIGVVAHKVANNPRVGLNRHVRRASMGFLEI